MVAQGGLGSASGEEAPQPELGLALSGGGFRAAFFHVGVLARLAETGVLAKVEVISTVSGGSIVGALYYLLLRRELEANQDGGIGTAGYVRIVEEVETRLLAAVQKNIRARVFANLGKNLRMTRPDYSRSDRIGALYDLHLYRGAWGAPRETSIQLRELFVRPAGNDSFAPAKANPDREEKVPILLLNATTLNSGHNWRFEAIRMGESLPEDQLGAKATRRVDKNLWLLPGYFDARPGETDRPPVPAPHADFGLGSAVAASAAVPGAFKPLSISNMYEGVRVQLVDGGVQDNQGIQGLRDRRCRQMIVSDASGQMDDKRQPWAAAVPTLLRSSSIAQDRIRDAQLIGSAGDDLSLVDLRRGLSGDVAEPGTAPAPEGPPPEGGSAGFGIDPKVQRALSEIRTDLDFFSRVEAHSLSLSGYLMSDPARVGGPVAALAADRRPAMEPEWEFTAVAAKIGTADPDYLRKLEAGRHRFGRLLRLWGWGPIPIAALTLAGLAAIVLALWRPVAALVGAIFDLPVAGAVSALAALIVVIAVVVVPIVLFAVAGASLLLTRLYER